MLEGVSASNWILYIGLNEDNLTPLDICFIPPDSHWRGTGTTSKMVLPSAFWVQGGGWLQQGWGEAGGLKENAVELALRQSIGILGFSVFQY